MSQILVVPRPVTTSWTCPECARKFARPRQAHSCAVVPLSDHLMRATPETRAIFERVMQAVHACGPVQVAPTKTGINLMSGTSLGSVSLHKGYVNIGLVFTREIKHARLKLLYRLSAQSFGYRVRVDSPSEVDADLKTWIREAYETGKLAGRRPR
jgi:hypothetical protein